MTRQIELENNLQKLHTGDYSGKPPYMTDCEWLSYLELNLDEIQHPAMDWCGGCKTYHPVRVEAAA